MSDGLDKNYALTALVILAIVALVAILFYSRGGEARVEVRRGEMSGSLAVPPDTNNTPDTQRSPRR